MKRLVFMVVVLTMVLAGSARAEKEVYVIPKVGISAFTGVLGLEVQYKHFALDVGFPASGGLRYYARPSRHSWFGGIYGMGFGYDHDETRDGVAYDHASMIQAGVGGGYRWLWRDRWSLELGLAIGNGKERWSNRYGQSTERTATFLWPVAAFGIAF